MKKRITANHDKRVAKCLRGTGMWLGGLIVLGVSCPGNVTAVTTLTVSPATATLTNYQSATLTVSDVGPQGVQWTVTPPIGTLVPISGGAVFTVPGTLTSNQTVEIMATSNASPSVMAKAILLLVPTVSMLVTPASADLISDGQQALTATVSGSTNTGVSWTLDRPFGTISSSGVYKAPSNITADTTVTVKAIAQANTTVNRTVPIRLHPNGIYFRTQANGLQSVVYEGTDYNHIYEENLMTGLRMQTSAGPGDWIPPTHCSRSFNSTTATSSCYAGSDLLQLQVSYSVPSYGTLRADVQFTNRSATNTVADLLISTLGVSMAQYDAAHSNIGNVDGANPVRYVSYGSGRFAVWTNTPGPNVSIAIFCGW
ncbi:MAG: trimeric autotransporter adhesin, partial [Thermoleophilaceae bacterium]|nr:trimeric autotransporter adhesin [Thermoleophilaceae bacterium]